MDWKKANAAQLKRNDKQSLANYRSISRIPICETYLKIFFISITLFPQISQALNLEKLASIDSYKLPMGYMHHSMRYMKFQACFLTYLRHLIRFDMRLSSLK